VNGISPRTFDDKRVQSHPCTCGRHRHTGDGHYCPWAPVRVPGRWGAIWAQADLEDAE
jgi:hypothetical protein